MAKNKKTRKEKKLSDQRRQIAGTPIQQLPQVMEKAATPVTPIKAEQNKATKADMPAPISTSGYTYLFADLTKTAILTCSIIIAEIIIRLYAKF